MTNNSEFTDITDIDELVKTATFDLTDLYDFQILVLGDNDVEFQ